MATSPPSFATDRPLRMLIVDDMPQVRQDLRLLLELTGKVQVIDEAADGVQAIAQVEQLRPEVVLMDLEMPGIDGYTATREIKRQFPACRIIALTVHGDPDTRQKASDAGADEFVVKGAPANIILQALANERCQ